MSYTPIVPALIPDSAQAVKDAAESFHFAKEFHLDVIDGIFVPKKSWPYEPLGDPMEVKPWLDSYTLEVDLMVADPAAAAEAWIKAGADMLVFHVETIPLQTFEQFVEDCPASVGVSCHGDTDMETLMQYLKHADYVQLMGIAQIGSQGQPFDESVFDKIAHVQSECPGMSITIDGSVNQDTIAHLAKAGADRFITGSAVAGADSPKHAYAELQALINV